MYCAFFFTIIVIIVIIVIVKVTAIFLLIVWVHLISHIVHLSAPPLHLLYPVPQVGEWLEISGKGTAVRKSIVGM